MDIHLRKHLLLQGLRIAVFTSLLTFLFIFTFSASGRSAEASEPLTIKDPAPSAFRISTVDKRADSPAQWVAAGGGIVAYGAGQHVDFALVDEPFAPVSSLTYDGIISEALILEKFALLSQEGLGLRIVDLSDPSNPVDLGSYPLSGTTFHLANWGNLLLVAGVDPGMEIFELSLSGGPPNLTVEGFIPVPGPITAIAASEGNVYIATEGNGIEVYDLSDPTEIVQAGILPVAVPVKSMTINGEKLFVAAGAEGLHIFDLSTPGKEVLATHPVPSESLSLAGRLVYLAAGSKGLHLLNAGPLAATTFDVFVNDNFFNPAGINVNVGDTVLWTWAGANSHSSTSGRVVNNHGTISCQPDGTWDSGAKTTGTFQHTFNSLGAFRYFDSAHCPQMVGTVNVLGLLISVVPAAIDFGNLNVGATSDQSLTIANPPNSIGPITGTVGTLSAPFSVVSGGGAFTLAPGQSMSVTVRFSPTATGAVSVNLSITHDAANQANPITVSFSGTGVPLTSAINMTVSQASVNFGNVALGQSSDQKVTLTNQANSAMILTGNVVAFPAEFTILSGGEPFSLAPGDSETVTIRFTPTTAGGASGTLSITHNATNQGTPTNVPLSGNGGTTPPVINLSVTPVSVNFGNVNLGQFLEQTITIANPADSTGTLTGSVGTLAVPFSVQSGGGTFNLPPGQSMTVTVRFSPTSAGAASGSVTITHNATSQGSPAHIPLSGTGTAPGGPNVVISTISGPKTGKPGGRIALQNTVTNEGSQAAGRMTVNFYLSTDNQIDTGDKLIGKRTISSLAPGASNGPASTMVTIPRNTPPGSYFIGGIAGNNTNFDSQGITVCLPLSKSRLLSPRNRGANVSTAPALDWSDVTGASTYDVQVAIDSGFTNIVASTTGLTGSQWTVAPALASGTTYFWRARAVNACEPGAWSATWRFKTM